MSRMVRQKMSFISLLKTNSVASTLRYAMPIATAVRHGHTMRGKPPGIAKTIEQRLQEEHPVDLEVAARINIGFPRLRVSRSQQLKERLAHLKAMRVSTDLEKKARSHNLLIDLEEVQQDYRKTKGQYDLQLIADHYGVFQDLFGSAYFIPRVTLNIKYPIRDNASAPVHNGNIIKPTEAAKQPDVSFDGTTDPITGERGNGNTFWTLLATNPDAHFTATDAECVHWFVANIPNGDLHKGDVLVDYLPPFPPRGIGYQRFVFVLYKQNSKLDFNAYKVTPSDSFMLEKRTFKTIDFYRKYQDDITPAGLCFYQSNWDKSLTQFYHNFLKINEPIFEYDFPAPYLADQKFFPLKQPFNLYMDKHRDPKQVNKEYLEKKLAKTHPFNGPEAPMRFPNAHPIRDVPSWLRTEIRKERLGKGRINDY